jgi:broad specificity phosphatase PhoE
VTQWNASRRFQGHTDVPLSPEGREQARLLAGALRSARFDVVYASDLARALETARIVAEPHGLNVISDPRLREFDFGAWEGLTWDEIVATRPHLREHALTAAAFYAPDGGETFAAVCARVRSFFDEPALQQVGRAAVVMHAGPLHAALEVLGVRAEGSEPRTTLAANFRPASFTRIAMEPGGPRLITLSDVRHLHSAG